MGHQPIRLTPAIDMTSHRECTSMASRKRKNVSKEFIDDSDEEGSSSRQQPEVCYCTYVIHTSEAVLLFAQKKPRPPHDGKPRPSAESTSDDELIPVSE